MNLHRSSRAAAIAALCAVACVASATALSAPAHASDATVTVRATRVDPRMVEVSLDGTVTWDFTGPGAQTSTSDQGFWSSDPTRAGDTYDHTFTSAGRFAYHSRVQPGLRGAVSVPVRETGSPEHGYELRWSTIPGGRRLSFDVQTRTVGGAWSPLLLGTKDDGALFAPGASGRYQVRARTDRGSSHSARSGWSPAVTVVVS